MIGYDWEEKAWGRTRCEWSGPRYSNHLLQLTKGGYCSLHYHRFRGNVFKVLSGVVRVVRVYGWQIRSDTLKEDNTLVMPPEVPHQFQVLEAGEMIEEYFRWRGDGTIDLADIERLTIGGCDPTLCPAVPSVILENGTFWREREWGGRP